MISQFCDPHHHLWSMPSGLVSPFNRSSARNTYMVEDFIEDIGDVPIVSTVLVEAGAFYRSGTSREFAPLGETEAAVQTARVTAGGPVRVAAGIVARTYLDGDHVAEVLAAHREIGGENLKGIRQGAAFDVTGTIVPSRQGAPDLYGSAGFREGFRRLADFGLSFDAWLYHPQIPQLADLAATFPNQPIVLDHMGSPLGMGAYAGKSGEVFNQWRGDMRDLARRPNVWVKIGGLGMPICGLSFGDPSDAITVAEAMRPYVETCIELFGAERCMFESNFPPDAGSFSYGDLWAAFSRLCAGASPDECRRLFHDTAAGFYRLDD